MEKNHANSWHSKALAVDQHVQVCFYWREKCNMAPSLCVCFGGKAKEFLLYCIATMCGICFSTFL